ncbi:MAG: proteophosphoglycan precursor [Rhodospirillales bacterium]|nr:proteophosphoglycan precursor [Rhodospirillales bacterium]
MQSSPLFTPDDKRPDENYPIRIARDGTWFHEGAPIGRIALAKLFATVLKRDEAGQYWLVTPAERGRIQVEDAPFVAVAVRHDGDSLVFRTNLEDEVAAGPDRPIRVVSNPVSGEPSPYVLVRDRLEARINRATFYELASLAVEHAIDGRVRSGVWSRGAFFPLDPDERSGR